MIPPSYTPPVGWESSVARKDGGEGPKTVNPAGDMQKVESEGVVGWTFEGKGFKRVLVVEKFFFWWDRGQEGPLI